jgi:hypothetical protein
MFVSCTLSAAAKRQGFVSSRVCVKLILLKELKYIFAGRLDVVQTRLLYLEQ